MSTIGYSDRVNHALAFAAKHHDRQVRKGTRLPYLTHPANVAIILTRYGRDEQTVVAGILHDVVQDCVRESMSRETLEQRIGEKFGSDVLSTVLAVTYRRLDDDGVELAQDERRDDYLARLSSANESARWVCAADKLHNANSILSDLRRTIDPGAIWHRFSGGRDEIVRWYRRVYDRLNAVGFTGAIMPELEAVVVALEEAGAA
ncbi:MAG TPA: HD domain-containing protein [Gemmatimonadaceae bacterium]